VDHSKEEGRTAGKDYPTRNVKVVNIRGVMHLFFDRLSKSPDSLSAGGFFFVHTRGRYDIGAVKLKSPETMRTLDQSR